MQPDRLRALALAVLPEAHLLRRLASELARIAEDRGGQPATWPDDARQLLRRAFPSRRITRPMVESLVAESERQVEIRRSRKWERLDEVLVGWFQIEFAKEALKQVRRARKLGKQVVIDKTNRVFKIASGRGWRVVPWKLPL